MFLKSVRLRNFKCIDDLELSFDNKGKTNRQWTFLTGENGTGKSNFLKAIALVTAGSDALGELIGDVDTWIKNGEERCFIEAVIETKKNENRRIHLEFRRGESLSAIIKKNEETLDLLDRSFSHTERNYFIVGYGATRRLGGNGKQFNTDSNVFNKKRSQSVGNLFNYASTMFPITSWAIDLDYRLGEKGIEIIKRALGDFLPDVHFKYIDKSKRQLIFETKDGEIPLEQLSDGYQNMASWIGDLLYRITSTFEDYNNPFNVRGVLLIDEIELHLHPLWQRKLHAFLTEKLPNFQIIVTSHSPLTAQQAGEGELYALKRNDDNKIELVPFIGSPRKLLVNQLLMTPVFGLPTDESYEVQKLKEQYRNQNSDTSQTRGVGKKQVADTLKLKEILPERPSLPMSKEEKDLLLRIEQELKLKK